MMFISAFSCLYARIYCIRHFPESRFRWVYDKEFFKPMLSFSGWEMFGNMGRMAKNSGINMLVNMFFGVAVNAAVSVGNTVSGAVNGLAFNMVAAFRPGITKAYAKGSQHLFEQSIIDAITYSFIIFNIFSIPLIIERAYVLQLWLGTVPPYATEICALHLIFNSFTSATAVLNIAIQATGNNRGQNIFIGISGLIAIIFIYFSLKLEGSLLTAIFIYDLTIVINLAYNTYLLGGKNQWKFVRKLVITSIVRP